METQGKDMFGVIEGTGFEILDPRFAACIDDNARVERLVDRRRAGRGPGLVRGRPLSDLVRHSEQPHDALRRDRRRSSPSSASLRTIPTATPSTTRAGSSPASTCTRRVTRTEHRRLDHRHRRQIRGQALQFAERRRWSSPTTRSGSPTPPTASTPTMRAIRPSQEIDGCHVYRIDPTSGAVDRDDAATSSGRTASPSRSTRSYLYVADTGATHVADGPRHIRRFTVGADGTT